MNKGKISHCQIRPKSKQKTGETEAEILPLY